VKGDIKDLEDFKAVKEMFMIIENVDTKDENIEEELWRSENEEKATAINLANLEENNYPES
jgi:hypothetical protein